MGGRSQGEREQPEGEQFEEMTDYLETRLSPYVPLLSACIRSQIYFPSTRMPTISVSFYNYFLSVERAKS